MQCTRCSRTRGSTTIGCKGQTRCSRTQGSTTIGGERRTRCLRTRENTTSYEDFWYGMQVCRWKIYISSDMRIMECTLRSWLWVPSPIFLNTRFEEIMLPKWSPVICQWELWWGIDDGSWTRSVARFFETAHIFTLWLFTEVIHLQ